MTVLKEICIKEVSGLMQDILNDETTYAIKLMEAQTIINALVESHKLTIKK
jgi:hypothetical protein